jgi:hypothetical protein
MDPGIPVAASGEDRSEQQQSRNCLEAHGVGLVVKCEWSLRSGEA